MLYEKIMKELCREMGITWAEEQGFPDVNGTAFSSVSMQDLNLEKGGGYHRPRNTGARAGAYLTRAHRAIRTADPQDREEAQGGKSGVEGS